MTKALESIIKRHRSLYWDGKPEISDSEYDDLLDELKELNPRSNLLNDIEHNLNSENKIKHDFPMLSLQKTYSYEGIINWARKICETGDDYLIITPKYDGISAKYQNEILSTRGDGEYGENITDKIEYIDFEFEKNKTHIGEIIIKKSVFKNLTGYATERNFVAGIINSKKVNIDKNIKLTFIEHKENSIEIKLNELDINKWNYLLIQIIEDFKDYPLDGIVFEVENKEFLGSTSHHPRNKIAFKFKDESKISKILDVKFSCGKTKITPIAHIEPIEINGVTIKKVSLHNAKMLLDNDVHINDIIKVVRSGDVIPYISSYEKNKTKFRKKIKISNCPACGGKISYIEPNLVCENKECLGSLSRKIYQTLQLLEILNIGISTVEKTIEFLNVKTILDLFSLTEDDVKSLPGFADKSAENFIENIKKAKETPIEDYRLLASLNIPEIGITLSKNICKMYDLNFLISNLNCENKILGFSEKRMKALVDGLVYNYDLLTFLLSNFKIINSRGNITKSNRKTICFSGKFPELKSYYKEIAKNKGFDVVELVTKHLNCLVTNGPSTSKASSAKKYNIEILNLDEFLNLPNK